MIRVILGPQDDYFTAEALHDFLHGMYTVTRESDRMGSRLEGPLLAHRPDKKPEIVSDGMVPGAIQVPGSGAPIVMLADGPTVGGYPKIATVISVDLPKLAVMTPGSRLCFEAVTVDAAETLLQGGRERLAALLASITPLPRISEPF
jgi:allophanate hydrolase